MVIPSRWWRGTHDSAVLPIRPIFRVRSPDRFLMIFAIFSLKSPPNMIVTPSQQWQSTHDSVLPIWPIFRVRSPDRFLSPFFHSNRHRIFTQDRGFTLCAQRAFITCYIPDRMALSVCRYDLSLSRYTVLPRKSTEFENGSNRPCYSKIAVLLTVYP